MAQLAIKGHATRGKEVIEILEMLGGKNTYKNNTGFDIGFYYSIEDGGIRSWERKYGNFEYTYFTLEEFEEKFPYKIGDKVIDMNGLHGTITAMSWDESNCTVLYTFKDDEVGTNRHGYTAIMLKPYIVDTGCCSFPTTQPSYTLSVESIKI